MDRFPAGTMALKTMVLADCQRQSITRYIAENHPRTCPQAHF